MNPVIEENFRLVKQLYNEDMADNVVVHDLIYSAVFGDDEYIGQFSDNSASELLEMANRMSLPEHANVLDVGCGRGRIASYLADKMQWDVTGIELADVPLNAATGSARFVRGNIYQHEFDTKFDGVYGTGSFCHFDADRLFARVRELLKPGGSLAFMERTRLGEIPPDQWDRLTREWHCPTVYSSTEYQARLAEQGFGEIEAIDLTDSFQQWQSRSVTERVRLRDEIVAVTSPEYFETSLRLAQNEADATAQGWLGYGLFVARKTAGGSTR